MSNILRFLNNVRNNNEINKVFESINKKYPDHNLCATTPVASQILPVEMNESNEPCTIIFSENAYSTLQNIRNVDHKCTSLRSTNNLLGRPLEFICYGYRDFDGDIFIDSIEVPLFEYIKKLKLSPTKEVEHLAFSDICARDQHIESTSRMYDYLSHNAFTKKPIGSELVAILGTTKHPTSSNTSNCFQIRELADAVIPNVSVHENISSGILAITPKTIEANSFGNKKLKNNQNLLKDGSLECAIISYSKNQTSGLVKPTYLSKVTRAIGIKNGKHFNIKIDSSNQPLNRLYRAKNHTLQEQEISK
jgi:hypothetical protein